MRTIDDFYAEAALAVGQWDEFASRHSLSGLAEPDHLSYKCDSAASYEKMRELLESHAKYIYQSTISNRRVSIVKLKKPVPTTIGDAGFLELADQKPDQSQKNGFDHIEIYPTGMSYEGIVKKLHDEGEHVVKVERPHHTTHDVKITNGFLVRLSYEPLMHKIKTSEML